MNDPRDPALARRLRELDAPDHLPGFWADLRAELANPTDPTNSTNSTNSTNFGPDAGPDPVEYGPASDRTGSAPDAGPDVVEFRPQPARRPRPLRSRFLAAAAVALVALVTAGVVLSSRGDDSADVATDPTLSEDPADPTTTSEDADPLRPDGEPIDRGFGRPVAVDPTGTFLYVAAPAPDGGFGCEAAPAEVLYVEFVDGSGERRLASPGSPIDATGGVEMRFGPEGTVAVHARCEGFGATIVTGQIVENGEITEPSELTVRDLELGRPVDGIVDLEVLATGLIVAATHSVDEDGTEHRRLYSLPIGSGEMTDLERDGAVEVEVTDDGRLAVLTVDGRLLVDGEVRHAGGEPGRAMVLGHGTIALVGPNGTEVIALDDPDAGARTLPVGGWQPYPVAPASLVLTRIEGEDASVSALDLVTGETTAVLDGGAAGLVVLPDGSRLFAAGTSTDPTSPPPLVEQRLTR